MILPGRMEFEELFDKNDYFTALSTLYDTGDCSASTFVNWENEHCKLSSQESFTSRVERFLKHHNETVMYSKPEVIRWLAQNCDLNKLNLTPFIELCNTIKRCLST